MTHPDHTDEVSLLFASPGRVPPPTPAETAPSEHPISPVATAPGYREPLGPPPPGLPPSLVPGIPDSPPAAPARPRRRLRLAWLVPLLALALVVGGAGGVLADRVLSDRRPADAALPSLPAGSVERPLDSVAGIAATVLPSVVSIEVTTQDGQASGSGFVLRPDGYILTNHHVVAEEGAFGARTVVLFADGTEVPATLVGSTRDYDLAVLKVDVDGLTPLVLGDSDAVVVGDQVVAIGAPLGLRGTVTSGIVSAVNRPVTAGPDRATFINAIQTDAAINPGNSGGPLVDVGGRVIGVNSAIAQPPGAVLSGVGSIGLGFAIPANQVRRTAEQIIETGRATYPIIGVLLDERYDGEGVQVATEASDVSGEPVVSGGPADRAGIRPGDVIVAIDGRPVTEPNELIVAIRAKSPGDPVVLTVRADGADRDVTVVLDEVASQ